MNLQILLRKEEHDSIFYIDSVCAVYLHLLSMGCIHVCNFLYKPSAFEVSLRKKCSGIFPVMYHHALCYVHSALTLKPHSSHDYVDSVTSWQKHLFYPTSTLIGYHTRNFGTKNEILFLEVSLFIPNSSNFSLKLFPKFERLVLDTSLFNCIELITNVPTLVPVLRQI